MAFIKDKTQPTPGFVPDNKPFNQPTKKEEQKPLSFREKLTAALPTPLKQIDEFGQGVKKFKKDVLTGVGKGALSTVRGTFGLAQKAFETPSRALGLKTEDKTAIEKIIPEKLTKPDESVGQNIGFYGEQIGEFFIPASLSLKAGKLASGLVKGGKIAKGVAKVGAISATEGVLGTGQSAMQSGELGKRELEVGAFSMVAPPILAGAGKGLKAIAPTPVKELVKETANKILRPSMKSLKDAKYYDKAEDAFNVLSSYKKKFDGVARNPKNVGETLSTLKNAKSKIYEIYSDISTKAGEVGAKFTPDTAMADLSNWIKKTGYSSEIKEYTAKQLRNLSDLTGANPTKVQDRIEELNAGLNLFGTGSDKIKTQIDASIASRLRKSLDDLILKTGGDNYQFYRNQYASLKTIEQDLARHAAIIARKSKTGLIDMTDIFSGGDILAGVLTGNPTLLLKGGAGKGIKEYFKWLNDPDRLLAKLFGKLEKIEKPAPPARTPNQKLLGEGNPMLPKSQNKVPIKLPSKTPSTVEKGELFMQSNKNILKEDSGLLKLKSGETMITPPPTKKNLPFAKKSSIVKSSDDFSNLIKEKMKGSKGLEKGAYDYLLKNKDKLKTQYLKENTKKGTIVLDSDIAKTYYKKLGYNNANASDFQEPASLLTNTLYKESVEKLKNQGKTVFLTAGGPGSGKSTAIEKSLGDIGADLIYDSSMSNLGGSIKRIELALENGLEPTVAVVLRDPKEAWFNGVLSRTKAGKRHVNLKTFMDLTYGSINTIQKLSKKYGDKIDFKFIGNYGGLDDIKLLDLDSINNFNKQFNKEKTYEEIIQGTKKLFKKGELDPKLVPEIKGEYSSIHKGVKGGNKNNIKPNKQLKNPLLPKTKPIEKFEGLKEVSTKLVEKLKGKTLVSKQFISDLTKGKDMTKPEIKIITEVLDAMPEGKVNVKDFAKKVEVELLPLNIAKGNKFEKSATGIAKRYENITLNDDLRGNVAKYTENIYESPVKTSAGEIHFGQTSENYYGHTRVEDMGIVNRNNMGYKDELIAYIEMRESQGATKETIKKELKYNRENETVRRVIEVQSDLYQKGNLEKEMTASGKDLLKNVPSRDFDEVIKNANKLREKEIKPLQQYNDPTAHFRMVREEIKQAAIDGKTKLQFPTGETAMKVEGMGNANSWYFGNSNNFTNLIPDNIKIGMTIKNDRGGFGNPDALEWVVTEILENGKFKAIEKEKITVSMEHSNINFEKAFKEARESRLVEQFDISEKVDRDNPIYKFYEKTLKKYLKKIEPQMKEITDDRGVSWFEIPVSKEKAKMPVEAFGVLPLIPFANKNKNES